MSKKFTFDKKKLDNLKAFVDQNAQVKIGVLASKKTARPDGIDSVALAAIHEFGSIKRHIPQRSFLRLTMVNRKDYFVSYIEDNKEKIMNRIAIGDGDGFLNRVGMIWQNYVIDTFSQEGPGWEKLKQATINRKGTEIILRETSQMMRSIHYEVVK